MQLPLFLITEFVIANTSASELLAVFGGLSESVSSNSADQPLNTGSTVKQAFPESRTGIGKIPYNNQQLLHIYYKKMEKGPLRMGTSGTLAGAGAAEGLLRSSLEAARHSTSPDFVLQWGNRKRLRCMKVQGKDDSGIRPHRATVRVDRRVVRTDQDQCLARTSPNINHSNGHHNLRRRACWPPVAPPPPPQLALRNSENPIAMRGQSNGGLRADRRASHYHHNDRNKLGGISLETAHNSKKGGCGSSSGGSGEAAAAAAASPPLVWPPKFMIALTNKEKEEDFIIFKGSKPPHRPKKRAKLVQRTVNLVCPGGWLCDLTLERYEVREKKIPKKTQRPRGLKAMGNMDSDTE
ncbi:hypothetical protein SAY87_026068 [Trapa incisa]|uniref:Uncharacterized protein n=1 Tax=Trapa incisa TaxID=236973 RepID=A0AAN7GMH8_9MYRT|nr:hypothetical protein SAY87_026068 [Trapa incisa]